MKPATRPVQDPARIQTYERLVNRHKDAVYRQIARVCGNYDDTEDVLVETLLTAYRAMDQVKDEGAMRAWLATIGRRICRRMKEKEAVLPIVDLSGREEPSATESIDDELEAARVRECIKSALDTIPEHYRAAYLLRDVQQLSAEEAADQLGISVRNLKSRLHRARKRIRQELDKSLCEVD